MARGGYRPNSGPPKGTKYKKKGSSTATKKTKSKKPSIPEDIKAAAKKAHLTPLEYMLKVMNDPSEDKDLRARMATSAAPYCHSRKGEGLGKKEERKERVKAASQGRFAPGKAPLKAVK